jgi:hypothetical protein
MFLVLLSRTKKEGHLVKMPLFFESRLRNTALADYCFLARTNFSSSFSTIASAFSRQA